MMRYWGWNNWTPTTGGWGGYGSGWIIMVLFWIFVFVVIIALVRHFADNGQTSEDKESTALNILKERYAKGEINKKEFDQMKKDIS